MLLDAAFKAFAKRLLRLADDPEKLFREIARQEPLLAKLLRDALLNAYLKSAKGVAKGVLPRASFGGFGVPTGLLNIGSDSGLPIRWPGIESAVRWLASRRLLTPNDFALLDSQAQSAAFTVARTASLDAVRKVRDAITESVQGGSLGQFRARVRGALHESMLTPARTEALFRTHEGIARSAGQRAIYEHPLVEGELFYVLFSATHDERTRESHLALEKWGQNGTAVYRMDDPIWRYCWPPISWNCRCHAFGISTFDAAKHGSKEARRWLKTGIPPTVPEYAKTPYPVVYPPGWPSIADGIAAAV